MKKIIYSEIIFAITLLMMRGAGFAAGVGTAGARFLRLGVGARPVALGEAFSAVADDVNAMHWNPAGLAQIDDSQASISHNTWFTDITEQTVSYAQPSGKTDSLGVSVRYIHMGKIESFDKDDIQLEDAEAYSLAFILAGSRKFSEKFYSGSNIKIIQRKLDEESALGVALDFGFLYKPGLLQLGLAVQNLGTGGAFISEADSLPVNIKTGIACRLFEKKLILGLDFNMPSDENSYAGLGAEYSLGSILLLRAGYNMRDSAGSGLSLGFGVKSSGWLIDFAYIPDDVFDYTYRVSLGVFPGGGTVVSKKEPDEVKVKQLYLKGLEYMKKEKYADAMNIFTEVLSLDPSNKKALEKLEEANNKLKKK
ncbi:MAG: PorV/PorQ family protein [bacterium]